MELPPGGFGTATWVDLVWIANYVVSRIRVLRSFHAVLVCGIWEKTARCFTCCFVCTCKSQWGTRLATPCETISRFPPVILPTSIESGRASFRISFFPRMVSARPGISKKILITIEREKDQASPGRGKTWTQHSEFGDRVTLCEDC